MNFVIIKFESCLKVKYFLCKIRGIFVIMENYKSLFAKVFNLGSKFNFVKGLLANILVIMIFSSFVAIWPNFIEKLLPKSVFLLLFQIHSNF